MAKEKYTELKYVEKWSLAKMTAVFSAIMGFLAGFTVFPYLRLVTFGAQLVPGAASLMALLQLLNIDGYVLIAIPFAAAGIGALQGFIFGLVTAVLYNFFARKFGGIKISI